MVVLLLLVALCGDAFVAVAVGHVGAFDAVSALGVERIL